MPIKIPWEVIGPVAAGVVAILVIVFAFILKFQKQSKVATVGFPNSSTLPKPTDTISKKTLCFEHESKISSNATKIGEMKEQQEIQRKENREDHDKLSKEIDDMGTKIISEISKNKSQ